jgi:putative endonuclease
MHGIEKRIVYIIRSDVNPSRHYVGITNDLPSRLHWHNHGPSGHTLAHRPWSIVVSLEFPTEKAAVRFEKYLKSGSGRSFATRHFGACDQRTDRRRPGKDGAQLKACQEGKRRGTTT